MVTTTQRPEPAGPALRRTGPRTADRAFRLVALCSGLLVLVVMVGILLSTLDKSLPAIRYEGIGFLTSASWDPANGKLGGLALIYGTVLVAVIALAFAVPLSVGIALFMAELCPRRLRTAIVYVIDLLAAVPSVVYGLWGLLVLAGPLGTFYGHVSNAVQGIPVLDTLFSGNSGLSFFTAGLIVALMVTPIITSLSREVFATAPASLKEGALALGATRWEMIRTALLGYGRGGVIGSIMLGLGRALGETIAVAMTIGSLQVITLHLFTPGDTLAAIIANQFGESNNNYGTSGTVPFQAALIGLGLGLFVITIMVNLVARTIVARSERRLAGA